MHTHLIWNLHDVLVPTVPMTHKLIFLKAKSARIAIDTTSQIGGIWKHWNYVIPLLYSKSGKQMENYCKYVRYHVDLQLKFTVPSLLIKLVHNCYLNSLFFTALLKTWERNEKGTENMSDMPRSAPFTMQLKKKKFPRTPRKVSGTSRPRFRLAALGNGIFRFFCKSLLEGMIIIIIYSLGERYTCTILNS